MSWRSDLLVCKNPDCPEVGEPFETDDAYYGTPTCWTCGSELVVHTDGEAVPSTRPLSDSGSDGGKDDPV